MSIRIARRSVQVDPPDERGRIPVRVVVEVANDGTEDCHDVELLAVVRDARGAVLAASSALTSPLPATAVTDLVVRADAPQGSEPAHVDLHVRADRPRRFLAETRPS